jgi:hypothetical protein
MPKVHSQPWRPPARGYLLNGLNLIGVYDESLDFLPYEYDCLLGPLLVRLARRDNLADLSEYPWYALQDHFGLDWL